MHVWSTMKFLAQFSVKRCPKWQICWKKSSFFPHTVVEMTLFLLYFWKKQREFTIVFIFVKSWFQICTAALTHNPASPPSCPLISPTWLPLCCSSSALLVSGTILRDHKAPNTRHMQYTITVCRLQLHQFISQLSERALLCHESVSWVLSGILSLLYLLPSAFSSELSPIFKEISTLFKIFLLLIVLNHISADDHRLPSSCWQVFYNWHIPDLPKVLGSKSSSISP